MKSIKELIASLLGWLARKIEPSRVATKPSDILADVIAAKILTEIDCIRDVKRHYGLNNYHVLKWVSKDVEIRSHFSIQGGLVLDVLSFQMTIKGRVIELGVASQMVISHSLYNAYTIKSAQKKARDEADNEFNALDALTDIFKINV